MPQIPYTGVPSVAPQLNPTPTFAPNIPSGAFGETIGAAQQQFGKAVQGAGDEVFARAIAMQQLNQQAEASAATAEYQIELGKLHAEYQTTQGSDAVRSLSPYIDTTEKLRTSIGERLSSDYARKLFDSETRNTRGRSIFNAAGHAATENRKFVRHAADARIGAAGNSALSNPTDEAEFQSSLKTVRSETELKFWDQAPEVQREAVAEATSKLWTKRIQGMAKEKPFTARKLLDQAVKDGSIRGADIGQITGFVENQTRTVGSRQISSRIVSGEGNWPGAKVVDIRDAQAAIGGFESGNRYDIRGPEVPGRGRPLGKYQVMPENLEPWLKQAGLPSMTEQEFLKSKEAQDQVFNTIFGGYMKQYGSFNEAASRWFTGRSVEDARARGVKDLNKTNVDKYLANTNAILAGRTSLDAKVKAGRAEAERLSPNDPLLGDYVRDRIIGDTNREAAIKRDDELKLKQTIDDAIAGGYSQGVPPQTIEELKATSPEVEAAVDALPGAKQISLMNNLERFRKAADKESKQATAQELTGMANSTDPKEIEEFLNTNIYEKDLNQRDMSRFIAMQKKLAKDRGGNLEVQSAIAMIQPQVDAAGLDRKDQVLMRRLRGAMVDAYHGWKEQNPNKPMDAKTAKEMGATMLQRFSSENFLYGKDYLFNLPLPNTIKKQIEERVGRELTEPELEQYRQEYVRQQYNNLQTKPRAPTQ